MTPLLVGFIVMGPISGYLSDHFGARLFSTVGMLVQCIGFIGLTFLPANFNYPIFAVLIFILGCGSGLFASPNTSAIMSSVPPDTRGVSSGMRATFQNSASLVSIGLFFSIVTAGLASALPSTFFNGLTKYGVPSSAVTTIAHLPPTAAHFGAFLGYNPIGQLLPPQVLSGISQANQNILLGKTFFPNLISAPFMDGLHAVFYISAGMCVIAACASLLRGKQVMYGQDRLAAGAVALGVTPTGAVAANTFLETPEAAQDGGGRGGRYAGGPARNRHKTLAIAEVLLTGRVGDDNALVAHAASLCRVTPVPHRATLAHAHWMRRVANTRRMVS